MTTTNAKSEIVNYLRGLETYQLYELTRIIHSIIKERVAEEYEVVKTNYSISLHKKNR